MWTPSFEVDLVGTAQDPVSFLIQLSSASHRLYILALIMKRSKKAAKKLKLDAEEEAEEAQPSQEEKKAKKAAKEGKKSGKEAKDAKKPKSPERAVEEVKPQTRGSPARDF